VKDDKDEHRNECNIHELPLGHTPFTTVSVTNRAIGELKQMKLENIDVGDILNEDEHQKFLVN
jgi:hypothetical protein